METLHELYRIGDDNLRARREVIGQEMAQSAERLAAIFETNTV